MHVLRSHYHNKTVLRRALHKVSENSIDLTGRLIGKLR